MKVIWWIFGIVLISFLYKDIHENFFETEIFKVDHIDITIDKKGLEDDLKGKLKTLNGVEIWSLDVDKVEEKLKKDIRYKEVEVEKELPGTIKVNVKTRNYKYYIQYKDKVFLMDESGVIYGKLEEEKTSDNIVLILTKEEDKNILMEICDKVSDLPIGRIVSQIYIKNINEVDLILEDGKIIKTNIEIEQKKYEQLGYLYSKLKEESKVREYIDIRFNDFIVK